MSVSTSVTRLANFFVEVPSTGILLNRAIWPGHASAQPVPDQQASYEHGSM